MGRKIDNSQVIKSMKQDVSKGKYEERIVPDNPIEPDEKSHEDVDIFEQVCSPSLKWSQTLKNDIYKSK